MSNYQSILVKLSSIDDVNEFVSIASLNKGDIDIRSGRYIVDGKSILGILSLNLSQPLTVDIYDGDFASKVTRFIVEEIDA